MIWERETFAVVPHQGSYWLCLKYESTLYSEPKVMTNYWPFQPVSLWDLKEGSLQGIEGAQAHKHDCANYSWKVDPHSFSHINFRLIDGGQTKPIKTTETPLPQPKVRKGIQTRYHNGWWQKYTQKYGWENIPVPPL